MWAKLAQKSHGPAQTSDEEAADGAASKDVKATEAKPRNDEVKGRTPPTKDRSIKAKISKLEVKLKPKPQRSPVIEDHVEKKDKQSPRPEQQQRCTGVWCDESEKPTFFVPKVIMPAGKPKQVKVTASQENKPVETEESKCAWLMRLLEMNRAQQQVGQKLEQMRHEEEACVFGWDTPDTIEYDLNLSMLYGQEDQSWYTKPIDDFLTLSPVPSQRLYKRHSEDNQEGASATVGCGDAGDISEITLDKLQAILTELLSPRNHDQESESNISQPDSKSQFYDCIQEPDHITSRHACPCGNYNESEFKNTSLPACAPPPSTCQSSVSSPIELAAQAIPYSTENEVLDDRPELYTLRSFHETDSSCPAVAAELSASTLCISASPFANAPYDSVLLWSEELDADGQLNLEPHRPSSLGVFNTEWALPTAQFSGLTYGNVCDMSTASNSSGSGGKVWLEGVSDEESLPTAVHSTLWDGKWMGFGNATGTVPYVSPLKAEHHVSQIWDVNSSRRQLDFEMGPPRERSSTLEKLQSLLDLGRSASREEAEMVSNPAFIEGGLYGNDWTSAAPPDINIVEVSDVSVSPCYTEEDTDCSAEVWEGYSLHPLFVRDRSLSADEGGQSSDEASTTSGGSAALCTLKRLNSSSEITPSENTAFQDCIPPRTSQLQHVQSEPILSPSKMAQRCKQDREVMRRLVQIKHLYKSDTSILKELGLASGSDYEEVDQKMELEISPDRHFKPIISPPTHVDHLHDITVFDALDKTPKADGDGSLSSSNQSTVSGYQLYMSEDMELSSDLKRFIPRFKIMKECEKSAQTGEVTPVEDDMTLTQRLVEDMNSMLESDDEDECPSFTVQDIDSSLNQRPVVCEGGATYVEKATSLSKDDLLSLWTGEEEPEAAANKSIWSCGTDQDLPSLPGSCAGSWSMQSRYGPRWSTGQVASDMEKLTESHPGGGEEEVGAADWAEAEGDDVFLEKLLEPDSVVSSVCIEVVIYLVVI